MNPRSATLILCAVLYALALPLVANAQQTVMSNNGTLLGNLTVSSNRTLTVNGTLTANGNSTLANATLTGNATLPAGVKIRNITDFSLLGQGLGVAIGNTDVLPFRLFALGTATQALSYNGTATAWTIANPSAFVSALGNVTVNGTITANGTISTTGTSIRVIGGTTSLPTAEDVVTGKIGDLRYTSNTTFQDSLLYGRHNAVTISTTNFTMVNATGSSPGVRWDQNSALSTNGSATQREMIGYAGLLFRSAGASWQWGVRQQIGIIAGINYASVTGDGVVFRFSVGTSGGAIADLAAAGYGIRITKSGSSILVVGQTHNGTTLTTSSTLATLGTANNSHWALNYNGNGTLTVLQNGVSIGTVSGGPTGVSTAAGPMIGTVTLGTATGLSYTAIGPNLTITDLR